MEKDCISVIVPVYNVEQYLDRCINSIVNQTYHNLDIILIDDGSMDTSAEICDLWEQKDPRIRVVHKKNGGASDSRNYGLNIANGDYIAFVDADDYIELTMYECMMQSLKKNGCDCACCGRYYVSDMDCKASKYLKNEKVFNSEKAMHELLNNGCIEEAVWDKIYAKALFEKVRFPVGETNEDLVVTSHIICRCSRIVHVGNAFYYYCYNSESVTKGGYNEKKRIMFKHFEDLQSLVRDKYPREAKFLSVLYGKYALSTMIGILLTENWKKNYLMDYRKYRKLLRKSFWGFVKSENVIAKQKIEAALLCVNLYALLYKIKRSIRG